MYKKSLTLVRIAGAAIMLLLVLCSLLDTWYMLPGEEEISVRMWDNVPANLLAAILVCAVLAGLLLLERELSAGRRRLFSEIATAVTALWALAVSLWWIFSAERLPAGDQAFIYGGASYFSLGDFSFLEPGGYCHIYPYQLGLTSLVELLYQVIPPFSYRPLQVLNALAAVGIVYTGRGLVREWTDSLGAEILYCLLMCGCFPLFFYTPWVYGDILSVFFAMLAVLCLVRYERKGGLRYPVGMVLSLTVAQLVRQTTTIVLIALILAVLVHFLWNPDKKRDKRLLIWVLAALLLPTLLFSGIYKVYELRSGREVSKGVPTVVTLAMGMQESRGGCGWDNNYQKDVYNAAEFDYDVMQQMGEQELRERVNSFLQNPACALEFYGKKLLSQWNAPLYQSVFFTADYKMSALPEPGSLTERVSESGFYDLLWFCDRLQFVVYLGMLCWFLLAVREDKGILRQLLAIAVIGGFFFSLLWEAKTRYILPYYLFMFPLSAAGYRVGLHRFYLHFSKTQDIIPM